ncbi:hypothetical protein D3C87_1607790 [compost metagenome]
MRDKITACEPSRTCSASTSNPGSIPSSSRAIPPKPKRNPCALTRKATLSSKPLARGSNMNLQPSERCRSFKPTNTSNRPEVPTQASREWSAPAVSSSATMGARPATMRLNSRSSSGVWNIGSINRSAPCASTMSNSPEVPACKGFTRTMSRDLYNCALMRPISSGW